MDLNSITELAEEEDGMKQLLLSELVAGEIRAQRSLRVLEHQQGRLTDLETSLSDQAITINDLQQDHLDLLEVHKHQLEVQELHRELIKLQDIQYLTKISNLEKEKANANPNPQQGKVATIASENESGKSLSQDKAPVPAGEKPRPVSVPVQSPTFSPRQQQQQQQQKLQPRTTPQGENFFKRKTFSDVGNNTVSRKSSSPVSKQRKSQSRDFAPSPRTRDDEDVSYFKRVQDSLGSLDQYLVGRGDSRKSPRKKTDPAHDRDAGSGARRAIQARMGRGETRDEDDVTEKITILRERLSSHRQSIETLSDEIVDLRHERIELLTYLKNLLDWKQKVECSLENVGINVKAKEDPVLQSGDAGANNNMPVSSEREREENEDDTPSLHLHHRRKQVNLSVSPFMMSNNDNDVAPSRDGNKSLFLKNSKLGERASKLWELSCRFFTPNQAHFLLTAPMPMPSIEEVESSAEEA